MKIHSPVVLIIALFLAFTAGSCRQESQSKGTPSIVNKTLTIEDEGKEIKFILRDDGKVIISGSEYGEGIEATYEQEGREVILLIGSEEIEAIYDGETLEFEEEEYRPQGNNISSVNVDAYEPRIFTSSQSDAIQYRLFIPVNYDENKKYPLVLFHHGGG